MVLNHSKSEGCEPSKPFTLRNSNKEFTQRQKNVFDQLNTLQCNLHTETEMEVEPGEPGPSRAAKSTRTITKHFRGKESIFKVPQDPSTYLKKIPDFKKNPHKWKKYSLADVKDDDMSESSNTKAALSFLNDLKKRNSTEANLDDEPPKKIMFKKIEKTNKEVNEEEKPSFRSSKVVMPEYVVGQKMKKEKKSRAPKDKSSAQLKLDHLYEDE